MAGGYVLCREPEALMRSVRILEWMEGSLATVSCLTEGAPPCARTENVQNPSAVERVHQIFMTFL